MFNLTYRVFPRQRLMCFLLRVSYQYIISPIFFVFYKFKVLDEFCPMFIWTDRRRNNDYYTYETNTIAEDLTVFF